MFKFFKPRETLSTELLRRGDAAARNGQNEEAASIYAEVLKSDPHNSVAHYKLANLLRNSGRLQQACDAYDRAIAADPNFANAYCNRGVVLSLLGLPEAACQSYDRATQLNPADALAFYNRGAVLRELGESSLALASIEQAIAINPGYMEAHCNRAIVLMELKQFEAAEASNDKAIEIEPKFAKAWANRGVLQQKRKAWDAALSSYDRAIELDPNDPETHSNRGVLLTELKRWAEALASLERALALRLNFPEAYFNRGNLFAALRRNESALENFDKAIALKSDYADAIHARGHCLTQMNQLEAAIVNFERVLALEPDRPFLLGALCYARMAVCDWRGLSADVERLSAGVRAAARVSPPFQLIALVDAPALHRQAAEIFTSEYPASDALSAAKPRTTNGPIRIGYFSADFHEHPVSILLAGVLEQHDRAAFEITAFSYGPNLEGDMRRRLQKSFDRFVDIRDLSDQSIAELSRSHGIDLAVDLMGHTAFSRPGIFALRAAPLQISWLGFAGTSGAECMDYLIGDGTVTPPAEAANYTEKIVRLPESYLPNDSTREIAATPLSRAQFALPPSGFVFCCFNNSFKINPATFDGWMRILAQVPQSVLWLSNFNPAAVRNLRAEALYRRQDPSRLIFAERMPKLAEHLARHQLADLFLDTNPYNAHSTAIDALWAGLPVLTCKGRSFASRVGASLLTAIRLPELITDSSAEYEERAVYLATHPTELERLRSMLAKNRLTTPLFDTASFTRTLESAFQQIYGRYQSGLPPEHFDIT